MNLDDIYIVITTIDNGLPLANLNDNYFVTIANYLLIIMLTIEYPILSLTLYR